MCLDTPRGVSTLTTVISCVGATFRSVSLTENYSFSTGKKTGLFIPFIPFLSSDVKK